MKKIHVVKKIKIFSKFSELKRLLEIKLVQRASRNILLAKIYYLFLDKSFDNEIISVLSGRQRHSEMMLRPQKSNAQLRRNTHRIEKGLIMRPRRAVFAEDYIEATVDYLKSAIDTPTYDTAEIRWSWDVLASYFAIVEVTEKTKAARKQFESLIWPTQADGEAHIPYVESRRNGSSISFSDLQLLFQRRRSVRWFKEEEVPIDLIENAIAASAQAPSACNRQPFYFVVSSTIKTAKEMANLAPGAKGFASQVPMMVAVVGDLSSYEFERDRHLIYIDSSLAVMQLVLALETIGLSTCILNWPDIARRNKQATDYFELDPHERVIMQIAIGYADPEGGIPHSTKKDLGILMRIKEGMI